MKTKTKESIIHINCSPFYLANSDTWIIDVKSKDYYTQPLLPSEEIDDADERMNAMLDEHSIHSFLIETPYLKIVKNKS